MEKTYFSRILYKFSWNVLKFKSFLENVYLFKSDYYYLRILQAHQTLPMLVCGVYHRASVS